MENHPIPQDVTNFQFKLIGNMTVKQFAYLATGTVLAILLLQIPVNILIKFPFSAFFAFLGIGLAYFPIGGRPMDSMIGYYIKALIRPTVFVYDREDTDYAAVSAKTPTGAAKNLEQLTSDLGLIPKDKLKDYLKTFDPKSKDKADEKENNFLMSISGIATTSVPIHPPGTASKLDLGQANFQIDIQPEFQINPAKSANNPANYPAAAPADIQKSQPSEQATAIPASTEPAKTAPSAPAFPNLITGLTTDARGNALSNILVEVRDKDNNPIRAFKTDVAGRFASATPILSGDYTIVFEDPKAQNKFKNISIGVTGQIISPIEAISVDEREELRKALFAASIQK